VNNVVSLVELVQLVWLVPVEYSLWEFRYADSSQYDLLDLRDKRVELLLRKFHGLNFPIKSKLVGFRFIPYLYEMYGFIYGYYS
jgi:hypothetical protein